MGPGCTSWAGWAGCTVVVDVVLLVRVAAAVAGSIADVGALASELVSALVVERTLLVDAAAPFGFVLGNVVPFVCVESCPGKRVDNDGLR